MLLQLSFFPPFIPFHPACPLLPAFPPFSSCPWVIHVSSLASTFPILFLTFPCLFSTYYLGYLFSVPFPSLSPCHSPTDTPPCDLHFYVISMWFCSCSSCLLSSFFLGSVVNICEFVVILVFIFLIFIFLDKSL